MSKSHPDDGKFVVVQGAKRISDLHESEQAAIEEANRQRALLEAEGQKAAAQQVSVKRNLLG